MNAFDDLLNVLIALITQLLTSLFVSFGLL